MDQFFRKMGEMIQGVPKGYWVLGVICIIGLFFRVYEFRDWMVFNPDQARDAQIVVDVLSGQGDIPLLGPQSGNTRFSLGPIFYYFSIFSGWLFGNEVYVFALPDLIFSFLTLPLLFLFLRKYFLMWTSITLTALCSISFFMIEYGRFAWNPNSIPFFFLLFLFGLHGLLSNERSKQWRWSIFTAIGLGVGVQLHTVLLIIFPILLLSVFFLLWRRKIFFWKKFTVILLLSLFLNTGQLIHETETYGSNTRAFFHETLKSSGSDTPWIRNTEFIIVCQIQSNFHILSSYFSEEKCGRGSDIFSSRTWEKSKIAEFFLMKKLLLLKIALCIIFSLGGYILLGIHWWKESHEEKRNFLFLVSLSQTLVFLVLVPVASEITLRYFIILAFVPFVLLGLWMNFFLQKKVSGVLILLALFFFFVSSNISSSLHVAHLLSSHTRSDDRTAIFGEVVSMANFLIREKRDRGYLYVEGNAEYEKRLYLPLEYLTSKQGLHLIEVRRKTHLKSGERVVYITGFSKKSPVSSLDDEDDMLLRDSKVFHNIVLFILEKK